MAEAKILIVAVIVICFIFLVALSVNSGQEYLNEVCTSNQSVLRYNGASWECHRTHYAEGYYNATFDAPIVQPIASANVFYNLTNWTQGQYYGVTWRDNGIDIQQAGIYRLNGMVTFTGANGNEYTYVLNVNGINKQECAAGMTASVSYIESLAITCLVGLSEGDHLTMRVRDRTAPANDVTIYKLNLNIVELI